MKRVLLYIGMAAIVASCTKSELNDSPIHSGAIQFTSMAEITRSTDVESDKTGWEIYDAIGIYDELSIINLGYDVQSITGSTANFKPIEDGNEIYYDSNTEQTKKFYAYYPFNEDVTGYTVPINLNESQCDLLRGEATATATGEIADFQFNHSLSSVEIGVNTVGDAVDDYGVYDLRVYVDGVKYSGSLNVPIGTLSLDSDLGHIEATPTDDLTGNKLTAKATALVMPCDYTSSSAVTIHIVVNGRAFYYDLNPNWVAGYKYKYGFVVGDEIVKLENLTILPWREDFSSSDNLAASKDIVVNSESVFEIYTGKGLAAFRDLVNGAANSESVTLVNESQNSYSFGTQYSDIKGKLMNNIYLGDICNATSGSWTPIGDYAENNQLTYRGVFDGNSYEVQGLYINTSKGYQALFGRVDGSTIKNIGVSGVVSGLRAVGGLVGQTVSGDEIINCYSNITATATSAEVGGLVGVLGSNSYLRNSYSIGSVSGRAAGGLVGFTDSSGVIANCYSSAVVTGTDPLGGLVGLLLCPLYYGYYNSDYYRGSNDYSDKITAYTTKEMKTELLNRLNACVPVGACYWKAGSDGLPIIDYSIKNNE